MAKRLDRRHLLILVVFLVLAFVAGRRVGFGPGAGGGTGPGAVERAYAERASDRMLTAAGEIERVLADDLEGSRHQRFIVRLASGHTVLVAHNIDLAERVPLARGDAVEVRGEYEWNERGGVLHWTHHDPRGRRPGGWVRHDGREYR